MAENTKGRLWVRLMKRHRVERDALIECEHDQAEDALRELLPRLDLSQNRTITSMTAFIISCQVPNDKPIRSEIALFIKEQGSVPRPQSIRNDRKNPIPNTARKQTIMRFMSNLNFIPIRPSKKQL